jgi:hypothetical protein
MIDDDKLDREWAIRNVLGGMSAGFGLRGMLPDAASCCGFITDGENSNTGHTSHLHVHNHYCRVESQDDGRRIGEWVGWWR